jgi:hypothetical protein
MGLQNYKKYFNKTNFFEKIFLNIGFLQKKTYLCRAFIKKS